MGLPDGWNNYDRVGKQVHKTRFIAFKVPLREATNTGNNVPEEKQLYPKLLVSLIPKLGLVIDLTNTLKYYNPDDFLSLGVAYQKIHVEGHVIPKLQCSAKFRDTVNAFLRENEDNDKLIGVHCTHGLNRSGFIICRYMIEEMKIPPLEAIAAFEVARGHKMERENYIDKLKRLTVGNSSSSSDFKIPRKEKLPSLAIDTEFDKGTQTNRGYWIDDVSVPPHHRNFAPASSSNSSLGSLPKEIPLNIRKRDLIPDGYGNYFVHITTKELQRTNEMRRGDGPRYDSHRYDDHRHTSSRNMMKRKQSHQSSRSGGLRSRGDEHSMLPQSHAPYMPNCLPMSGNNMAEDLLRMQNMNGYSQRPPYNPNSYPSRIH